jgi:HEAT repeat protein
MSKENFTAEESKIKKLIEDLENPKEEVRKKAVLALKSIGKPAVEPLIGVPEDIISISMITTFGIADALAAIGEPAVEPLVMTVKDDKIDQIRRTLAASALSKMSGRASESLIKALEEKAVEPLIETLGRSNLNPLLFSSVCMTLGNIGDSRAIIPLLKAIEREKAEKKGFASLALEMVQKAQL